MGWPPSSAAATSIEIRVLVEGFSKIMARLFPCRGRPWPPRLPLLARKASALSSSRNISSRERSDMEMRPRGLH